MTIELVGSLEREARELAAREGCAVDALVALAVRSYIDYAALTDLDARDVAETQLALAPELDLEPWEDPRR
ncbi:MAG: hypothetical protein SF066_23575 [Thermoanaerobaculia bacterium]|nr:hypothetical protein [Thermoanaerobaculia bacterium]